MKRVVLTRKGAEDLREELRRLKKQDRPGVIAAIAEARAHGDLSENAEYAAAKEQQGFIEGRIAELESSLSRAEILDPANLNGNGKVIFGATVELYENESDKEMAYQIVGDLESDVETGKISVSSPIARALLGKEEGDEVEVNAPGGTRYYEIIGINYL